MKDYQKSVYGWEQTLQVNLLSTVLLSLLLLPKLKQSKTTSFTPVLELVSSSNHTFLAKLKAETNLLKAYNNSDTYNFSQQYDTSKLFLEYCKAAMVERESSKDPSVHDVKIISVCPGAVKSDLARDLAKNPVFRAILPIFSLLQRSGEEGARTYISATATGPEAQGAFYRDDKVQP
jgi:NAD(P)-dependent dehydrogenase (short-subunit alcohol dehydrogenase family)